MGFKNEVKVFEHDTYKVEWNAATGEFLRQEYPGHPEPEWATEGPELADIHITNYCPLSCKYCYRESLPTKNTHMRPEDFAFVLDNLGPNVCQVAIGGGSPQHHPQFTELLKIAHDKGIVPSYTSNGRDMTPEILRATKEFCGAVAVSMHPGENVMPVVIGLMAARIRTAIHVVLSNDLIPVWTNLLKIANEGKGILGGALPLYSCIFLMHKPIGRGSAKQHPSREQKSQFVEALKNYKGPVAVGIDSCLSSSFISQYPLEELPQDNLGPCDSGCFSVFVDENLDVSPCSFNKKDIFSLKDFSFDQIWKEKFSSYRDDVISTCPSCENRSLCRSCQVLPQINVCDRQERTV